MDRLVVVHVSDIHIGSGLFGTLVSSGKWKSGLNGHELLLCEHLETAVRSVRLKDFLLAANERLHFVVSGDFTRIGSDNDFHLAYGYLLEQERLATPDLLARPWTGLRIPQADLYSVPGNHDHWNGYTGGMRPPAYNPAVFPRFFESTPWRHTIYCPTKALALELFGVDSNDGIQGKTNLWAGGVLSRQQLNALAKLLQDSHTDEKRDRIPRARAIVCHHGFTSHGGISAAQPLDPNSCNQLLALAHQFSVAAILTGHTHTFESKHYPHPSGSVAWELRSASTTQMDPQPEPQGFWVYVVELQPKPPTITWRAWKYQLNAQSAGFVQLPHPVIVC